jgi:hypothetical protein
MLGRNPRVHQRDDRLSEELKRLIPAMPPEGEWPRVLAKVSGDAKGLAGLISACPTEAGEDRGSQEWLLSRTRRRKSPLAYAVISLVVLVLFAGAGAGIFEAATHLGKDTSVVVITDDTTAMSPGSRARPRWRQASRPVTGKLWIGESSRLVPSSTASSI